MKPYPTEKIPPLEDKFIYPVEQLTPQRSEIFFASYIDYNQKSYFAQAHTVHGKSCQAD
jgi:hypothetical protein